MKLTFQVGCGVNSSSCKAFIRRVSLSCAKAENGDGALNRHHGSPVAADPVGNALRVLKIREFTYPTYVGGIETCLHQLCPALAKHGVNVTLLTCAERGLPPRQAKMGVEIRRIDFLGVIGAMTTRLKAKGTLYGVIARFLFLLALPIHAIKALKETGAQVIHVHCLCALSALPASLASLLTGKPLVITMHGTFLGYYGEAVKPPLSWIIPAFEKAYLRLGFYHKILAEDNYTRETLAGLGVSRDKILLLPYPGISLEKFKPEKNLENPAGEILILHHGRLVQKRGVDVLLKAMPHVLKEYPEARLIIAGDGPERQRLKRLAGELGIGDNVQFLGLVPYEKVPNLLKSSTLVVIPSQIEGHSTSLIEAAAAAKPIVATKVGGITDVIKHGETGILVDPGNPSQMAEAIIKLLRKPELAEALGLKAAERVKEYDVEKLAEREAEIYKNLAEHARNRAQPLKLLILALALSTQIPYVLTHLASELIHQRGLLLYGWVTLSACLFWFAVKRKPLLRALKGHLAASKIHVVAGSLICAASLAAELSYGAGGFFHAAALALLFISGVFLALGSLIPLTISAAYLAGVGVPALIEAFASHPISQLAAQTTAWALNTLGYEASASGAHIRISTLTGKDITAYIDHVCAGSTSLSVFLCLFTLITVDLNPKLNWKIAAFLAAGCLGAMGQAALRLILMGVIGACYGPEAFLTAHNYLGYLLFPIYFTLFMYAYLKTAVKMQKALGELEVDGGK